VEYSLNILRTIRLSQKLYMVKTKQQKFSLKLLSEPQTVVKLPCLRKRGFYSKTETSKTVSVPSQVWTPRWIVQFNHITPGFLAQHFKWPSSQKKSVRTTQRKVLISTMLTAREISLKTLRYAIPGTCIYNLWPYLMITKLLYT